MEIALERKKEQLAQLEKNANNFCAYGWKQMVHFQDKADVLKEEIRKLEKDML